MYPKLSSLISYLDSLSARVDIDILEELLSRLRITREDVREACQFGDTNYKRNKISGSDWYDLYLMCWRPGQSSAIHDHAASSCGFRIIEGISTEIVYDRSKRGGDLVVPVRTTKYPEASLCLAQDKDIHKISNEEKTDLITLHIYSPPLRMNYYSIDEDEPLQPQQ